MILLYIYCKMFCVNLKGVSDGKVVSLTKKLYGSELHFLKIFMKSLNSISDNDLMQFFKALFYLEFS